MWSKIFAQKDKIVKFNDKRIFGFELKTNDCISLFLYMYFPHEFVMFYDDYCFYLNNL